ncbi:MAG: hypothetical protein BWK76_04510 [Desulfobulbaceae bacterium A2]|nr:MAG: hypothetical protein BWK76_04510 [Desulfobulbaceae bacterium A2]
MIQEERSLLLEEEILLIRHSGEIPEVALHASLCYLTEEPDGPGLVLDSEERVALHEAVRDRYLEIILRDLDPRNRDLRLYRGLERAAINWRRLSVFCQRVGLAASGLKPRVRRALSGFLLREAAEVASGQRVSSVNCCVDALITFVRGVELDPATLPAGWQALCVAEDRG